MHLSRVCMSNFLIFPTAISNSGCHHDVKHRADAGPCSEGLVTSVALRSFCLRQKTKAERPL
jgi:hypothetical protein